MQTSLQDALKSWSDRLNDRVKLQPDLKNCIAIKKNIIAILYPKNSAEIIDSIKIANKYKIPIYPVCTGNNWGYGSSHPVKDKSVVINLSKMNKIIDFDPTTGVIILQPGVTQRQLAHFLDQHQHAYLIPVTGAGPDCSIVGNAIERGYGITPYTDHFASILSLEAILADGSVYKPMLSHLGDNDIDALHKWGMGPYLDGLFSQGNLGVVSQMSIALAPTPASMKSFFFSIKKNEDLGPVIHCIKKIHKELGGTMASINVMNQHRILAMTEPYPAVDQLVNGMVSEASIKSMANKRKILPWTCVGALYGNKAIVNATQKEIKKILAGKVSRLMFITPQTVSKIRKLSKKTQNIAFVKQGVIAETIETLNKSMQLFSGRPSEIALPLAYWITSNKPAEGKTMHPAEDNCGLIWYSPLVPMKAEKVIEFTAMVKSICINHQIEPLITLTSFSERCFDSTIPVLFNKKDDEAVKRAHACYDELFETGKTLGFLPYRLSIHSMDKLEKYNAAPELLQRIKRTLDPNNILAPGRYLAEK